MFFDLLTFNKKLSNAVVSDGYRINNVTENGGIFFITSAFLRSRKDVFVVLSSLYEAQKYYDKLINMLDESDVLFYPADELITSELLISSIEFKLERINTIKSILSNKPHIIVTNLNGILKKQLSKEKWQKASISLSAGDIIDIKELVKYLVESGYQKEYTVSKIGDFSVRGSIVDVFPIDQLHPIRFDFFDNEIEKIKEFDINTQKSLHAISSIDIIPLNEMFYTDEEKDIIISRIRSLEDLSIKEEEVFKTDIENLEQRSNVSVLRKYIGVLSDKNILDFKDDKKIFFIDDSKIEKSFEKTVADMQEYEENLGGNALSKLDYFCDIYDIKNKYVINYLDPFSNNKGINMEIREANKFFGDFESFVGYISKYQEEKRIIIALKDEQKMKLLKNELLDRHIDYHIYRGDIENGLYLTIDKVALGMELYTEGVIVLTEEEIYKRVENKVRYKSVYGEGARLKSIDELKLGDYVVHYDYGVGRYLGIETMTLSDITRDYIKILYSGNDFFYVPLEQIELVMKYNSNSDHPKLSKLGGVTWKKTKERVKNKLNDISDKLIQLYAQRNASVGYAYSEDSTMQVEFESDFLFEETIDQIKAIEEVKKDMESTKPMDRLICGDVGYGKTEIAMRGAFKAVYDNKQVAYLAPTTVLVGQHYNTFMERFSKYGAIIKKLTRLTSLSEQKQILKDLKEGKIDILIGTHRILSKDIVFKDLGLLIVDEEQRFGVEHKERIKEMKVNVDTMTLTATPIPRTLQMSMIGIKDLSIINTPPKNRYPVQTYVVGYHKTIAKEAMERELARGGQVFYLHNRVDDIERVAMEIKALIPYAQITFAHGQMNKNDLEDRIAAFVEKNYNILVCTTIIETGIDIPNANTLIIDDATRLGLSQLYQLRGRVGRSSRIAYAYLFYDEHKNLTEDATQRLEAIRDFTELGSGYKIAMRDLAIRGSGDILGSDQSGFIDSVGFEMYMKILDETVKEKQGLEQKEEKSNMAFTDRHIPKEYIDDDGIRIDVHKRIDEIKSEKDIIILEEELTDRFGIVGEKVNLYMFEKLLNYLLGKLNVVIQQRDKQKAVLEFKDKDIDGIKLFRSTMELGKAVNIANIRHRITITFHIPLLTDNWIIVISRYLEKLMKS